MTDMGVQLEPISQSLEQYGPWRFGDARFEDDHRAELEAALLQTAAIPGLGDRLLEISKGSRAGCHSPARSEVTLSVSKVRSTPRSSPGPASRASTPVTTTKAVPSLFPTTLDPSLAFTQVVPSGKAVVTFPLAAPSPQPRPCLKRRRPDTDVDGPGTFSISCKKRRLLRHLITSRLSQPFSLPATHILNREAVAAGDKKIVKLAAIMSARRLNNAVTAPSQAPSPPQQPSPSTWLRRAAVLNSLRSRVYATAAERANIPVPDLAAKTAVFQQSHGSTTAFVGGRYLITSPNQPAPAPHGPPPSQPTPGAHPHHHPAHAHAHAHAHLPACTTRLRIPSPKLRPLRSPELRVTRPLVPLEDIEPLLSSSSDDYYYNNALLSSPDDGVAFPTSELESRYGYDDDDDNGEGGEDGEGGGVYADFSVIFGGGGGGGSEEDGEGGGGGREGGLGGSDCFEDYMDDLDGIPWGGGAMLV